MSGVLKQKKLENHFIEKLILWISLQSAEIR